MFNPNGELIRAKDIDAAWRYWFDQITDNAGSAESRDGAVVGEVLNAITVIEDPTRCIDRKSVV